MDWEKQLDSFDAGARRAALRLAAAAAERLPPPGENVNMHMHTFLSYNAGGLSPARVAWEARKAGLYAAAICDFDVIAGLDEFLDAALVVGLRAAVHLETRAYMKEFADVEISSPGEPGVTYIMGAGFAKPLAAGSRPQVELDAFRVRAQERNLALVARINSHLGAVAIDYARDVLPLSPPNGCPTERHIVRAYVNRAAQIHGEGAALAEFWARILGGNAQEAAALLAKRAALEDKVRSRLAKQGGLGYTPPTATTFPPVDDFVQWVLSCDAIPMATWLDGTSAGESDANRMLDCLTAKGVAAVNIIPDRNWNLPDARKAQFKQAKLAEFVAAADARHLPINIGTELNRDGLPFVDDLAGPALRPYRETFLRGAQVMVGQSILLRFAGFAYCGAAAAAEFSADTARKNAFFAAVGALPPLREAQAAALRERGAEKALAAIRAAAARGAWVE